MPYVRGVPADTKNPFHRLVFWAVRRKVGRVIAPVRCYALSFWTLLGVSLLELCFERARRLSPELKKLAELRVASLVGCEFCIDIGSSIVRASGLSEDKVRELHRWRESARFSDDERLVLAYADRLSATPVPHDDAQMDALRAGFGEEQLVELTAAIAHENMRARLNHGLGYGSEGFSEGAACAVPATLAASA